MLFSPLKTLACGALLTLVATASQAGSFPPKNAYLGPADGSFFYCDYYSNIHLDKPSGLMTGTFDATSCGEFTSPLSGIVGKLATGQAMQVTLDWDTAYGFPVGFPNAWTLIRADGTYTSYNVDGIAFASGIWVSKLPKGARVAAQRQPMPVK